MGARIDTRGPAAKSNSLAAGRVSALCGRVENGWQLTMQDHVTPRSAGGVRIYATALGGSMSASGGARRARVVRRRRLLFGGGAGARGGVPRPLAARGGAVPRRRVQARFERRRGAQRRCKSARARFREGCALGGSPRCGSRPELRAQARRRQARAPQPAYAQARRAAHLGAEQRWGRRHRAGCGAALRGVCVGRAADECESEDGRVARPRRGARLHAARRGHRFAPAARQDGRRRRPRHDARRRRVRARRGAGARLPRGAPRPRCRRRAPHGPRRRRRGAAAGRLRAHGGLGSPRPEQRTRGGYARAAAVGAHRAAFPAKYHRSAKVLRGCGPPTPRLPRTRRRRNATCIGNVHWDRPQ
ncbi:hypothetical protein M885DRAFT_292067 [Pelagophyceae sp. CCMP2097]|nr:hypothetical protein M885DRAFT_292067 [Pelagophyceae sp. CCMP2097]